MWAGLGYYSRARNLHACAVAVLRDHGGVFPDTEEGLRALPGIGPYTAAAIARDRLRLSTMPSTAISSAWCRGSLRSKNQLPQAKPRIQELAATLLRPSRAGDSAQALMDLGSSICTPKKPACALCPLNEDCWRGARRQETFPRKAPKKSGTLRRGAAFVVTRGEELLVRTRPEKGLLGGMTEVPGSEWLAGQDDKAALQQAPALKGLCAGTANSGVVTHVFTHFPLELVVYTAQCRARTRAPAGMRWVPIATLPARRCPTSCARSSRMGWNEFRSATKMRKPLSESRTDV